MIAGKKRVPEIKLLQSGLAAETSIILYCTVLEKHIKKFEHIDLPAGETKFTFMTAWRKRLLLLSEKLNMLNEVNLCLGCSSGGVHGLAWDALGRQWPDCLTQPPHTWLSAMQLESMVPCMYWILRCMLTLTLKHLFNKVLRPMCKLQMQEQSEGAKRYTAA